MNPARIFVSYARADGAAFAATVRERLKGEGLSVWQDLVALRGGRDWWSQIEEALRSKELQHLVVVLTPNLLESKVVRQEIRLARQEGKAVHVVLGPGADPSSAPRWLGHVMDIGLNEQWQLLVAILKGPSRQRRAPMMAPEPPVDFVARPHEFAALKAALLDDSGDARVAASRLTAITATLKGAGGYGKTTLARALAHDVDIQEAFFDGVLWVEIGERPTNPIGVVIDLVQRLTGERPVIENINVAASALSEALGERRILLVIDDVWDAVDLSPYLRGGPRTARLVTTRLDRVVPNGAFRFPVDAMRTGEAVDLLVQGLPQEEVRRSTVELKTLVARLGEWAQLVKLTNGFLRNRVARGETLAASITAVNQRLSDKGLAAFDARASGDRTQAIARSLEISLDLLDGARRTAFADLAVFPEDVDVPIDVAYALWRRSTGLSGLDAEDWLTELHDLSLLLALDFDLRTFRLHDTTRSYLRTSAGARLQEYNRELVAALQSSDRSGALRRYDLMYRAVHLADAGEKAALAVLLTDPEWIAAKVEEFGGAVELVADYERHGGGDSLADLIGRTLRLTAGILSRDPRQALPQLYGRLLGAVGGANGQRFLTALHERIPSGALIETWPALTPPGAETARLEGHSVEVYALIVLPDGRLVSGSMDGTLRLWDPATGSESQVAEVFGGDMVTALALTPRGIACGSNAGAIVIWDPAAEAIVKRLADDDEYPVNALAVSNAGWIASGSEWMSEDDARPIYVRDLSGMVLASLHGHTGTVRGLVVLPDERLASASEDGTVRIWDAANGSEVASFVGCGGGVMALALLPDGRLAGGGVDGVIRFWDLARGETTGHLSGHAASVRALAILPDGRLASASDDDTIRVWDTASCAELAVLGGVDTGFHTLVVLADGRLASGSGDPTIRFWDTKGPHQRTAGLKRAWSVQALANLPDGRVVSGSRDGSIRLWDPFTGTETAVVKTGGEGVDAIAVTSDGRIAYGGYVENAIYLIDPAMKREPAVIHTLGGGVWALKSLPNGLLAGRSEYDVRVWSPETGREVHGDWDQSLFAEPLGEGRRVEARCNCIRVWDENTGAEVARWDVSTDELVAFAVLSDSAIACADLEQRIRVWDLHTKREISQLENDRGVSALIGLPDGRLLAGDHLGRLHWLEIKRG